MDGIEKNNSYQEPTNIDKDIDILTTTKQETSVLKNSVEKPVDYGKSFLDYLHQYPETLQKIEGYLQEPETIETWSLTIENIWGEFSFGAIDPQLQEVMKNNPTLLQHMKTGLSLYFTDWLNNLSQSQLKDVAQVGNSGGGLLSKASNFLGVFKNLTSFNQQMSAITYVTEGMDIYTKNLISDQENNINSLEAFQSPEGFMRLLKKHTLISGTKRVEEFGSFDSYFNIQQEPQINSSQILTKLADSYNDNAHTLMKKVTLLGPQVLEHRTTLKATFGSLYDQISQITGLFNGGKALSESIKGSWFEKPLNFISSIIGFGSLARYEAKQNIKNNIQELPDSQKSGLLQAINFVEHNGSDKISESFSKVFTPVSDTIYTQYNTSRKNVLEELPDEDVLKKAIERSLLTDNSYFIDSRILKNIGLKNVDQYYMHDKNGILVLNPTMLPSYQKIIKDNLDNIIEQVRLGEKGLLNSEKIISMVGEGKTKSHIVSYLLSGLSFPHYPLDTIQSSSVPQKKLETQNKKELLSSSSIDSLSIEEKAKITYEYLVSLGYDSLQATAITANIKIESNFNTGAVGDKNLKNKAYGLCQRREGRFENLKKFAKKNNKSWQDFYIQLDFMKQESKGRTQGYEEKFLGATTLEQATKLFDQGYERSNGKSIKNRVTVAEIYKKEFNNVA